MSSSLSGRTGAIPAITRAGAHRSAGSGVRGPVPPWPGPGQPDRWPLWSYLELGALPGAVPCARLHARQVLWEWRAGEAAGTIEQVVSELVTNAVHASRELVGRPDAAAPGLPVVRLWLATDESEVLVQVWDASPQQPRPGDADLEAESGRGLLLVATLSTGWGSFTVARWPGKVVWARIRA